MKRGEIVLFDFPFTDRTGSKLRPALVVQADLLNESIDDTGSCADHAHAARLCDGSANRARRGRHTAFIVR